MTGYQIIKLWIKSWFAKPEIKKTVDFENPLKVNIIRYFNLDSPANSGDYTVRKSANIKQICKEHYGRILRI